MASGESSLANLLLVAPNYHKTDYITLAESAGLELYKRYCAEKQQIAAPKSLATIINGLSTYLLADIMYQLISLNWSHSHYG
jgi:hypothetical protein